MLDRPATLAFDRRMSDDPRTARRKRPDVAARETRLARALRDNLRRRKEQQRAQRPPQPQPKDSDREPLP